MIKKKMLLVNKKVATVLESYTIIDLWLKRQKVLKNNQLFKGYLLKWLNEFTPVLYVQEQAWKQ